MFIWCLGHYTKAYLELCQISTREHFAEWFLAATYIRITLQLRSLTGFWIRLYHLYVQSCSSFYCATTAKLARKKGNQEYWEEQKISVDHLLKTKRWRVFPIKDIFPRSFAGLQQFAYIVYVANMIYYQSFTWFWSIKFIIDH